MAWGEPAWKTTQRDQEMQQQFPELQYASPEELMQVDNYRLTSGTGAVSDYSAGVMQLAAYAAEQERKRQEEAARSGPMPEGVDAGSMNPQPLYPTGTQENGPMPAEVNQGLDQSMSTDTPWGPMASRPTPGVPAGVAAAFPDTVGAGPVYNSSVTEPVNALTEPAIKPSGGPFDNQTFGPALTNVVERATTPMTWMQAATLAALAPPAALGFGTALGLDVGSQLVGGALKGLAEPQVQGLPEPLRTGIPMVADLAGTALSYGGGAAAIEHSGSAVGAARDAATGYRDLTEGLPVGASVKDVGGGAADAAKAAADAEFNANFKGNMDALMAQVEQEGGFNAETIAKYQELTGRRPTASMQRPEDSIAPPGTPGSRTAEDITQGAGNAILKNQNAYDPNISNAAPLMQLHSALQQAESVLPEQAANNAANRSRQAGAFFGALGDGPVDEGSFKQAFGAMRGVADRAQFTPLRDSITPEGQAALYQQIKDANAGFGTTVSASATLGQVLDGVAPTKSGLEALGKVFGPETQQAIEAQMKRLGLKQGPDWVQRLLQNPINFANDTVRSTNTLMDFATAGRNLMTAGVTDFPTYTKAIAQTVRSVGNPEVFDHVMTNLDGIAAERLAADGMPFLPNSEELLQATKSSNSDMNTGLLGKVPGVRRVAGMPRTFNDLLRPQMLQRQIENMYNAGVITAEQARDPAVVEDLGRGIRNLTGASNLMLPSEQGNNAVNNTEGTARLLLKFPNWYLSQFEFVGRAFTNGSISGTQARASLMGLTLMGTGVAVAGNIAQGKNPLNYIHNGVPQLALGDHMTIDPYGPIGELFQHAIGVGNATYKGATPNGPTGGVDVLGGLGGAGHSSALWARGMLSPMAMIGVDMLTGHDFAGNPTRDTQQHTEQYLGRAVSPFAIADAGQRSPLATGLSNAGIRGVRENTPTQNLDLLAQQGNYKDAQGNPVSKFNDLQPADKKALLASNPDLSQAKLDKAQPTTQEGARIQADALAKQNQIDAKLKADQSAHDPKAFQNWKDATSQLRDTTQGALGENYRGTTPKTPDPTKPWEMYGKAIADNTDPVTNKVDWSAVDAWRAGLGNGDQAENQRQNDLIDTNTGQHSTDYQKNRRGVEQQLQKAGYFDVRNQAWATVQQASPQDFGQYPTEDAFRAHIDELVRQQLPAGINPNGPEADLYVAQAEAKIPILSRLASIDSQYQAQWEVQNPALAKLAIGYGILNPAHVKRNVAGALIGQ